MGEAYKPSKREEKVKEFLIELTDCITDDADLIKAVELVREWAKETKEVVSGDIVRNQPVYSIPAMREKLKKISDFSDYFKVKKEVAPVSIIDEMADYIVRNANRRIKRREDKNVKEKEE